MCLFATGMLFMGGIAGGSGSLRNCYNAGIVHAKANDISIGGLTYNLWVNWGFSWEPFRKHR